MDSAAAYARARHVSLPGDLAGALLRDNQVPNALSASSIDSFTQAQAKANAMSNGVHTTSMTDEQPGYSQLAGLLSYAQLSRGSTPGLDDPAKSQMSDAEWTIGAAQYNAEAGNSQMANGNRAMPWNYTLFGDKQNNPGTPHSEWDADSWAPSSAPAQYNYSAEAAVASGGGSPLNGLQLQPPQALGQPQQPDMAQLQAALDAHARQEAMMGSRVHSPIIGSPATSAFPLPNLGPVRTSSASTSRPISPAGSFVSSPRIDSPLSMITRQPPAQSRLGDVRKQTVNRALDLNRAQDGSQNSMDSLGRVAMELSALELGLQGAAVVERVASQPGSPGPNVLLQQAGMASAAMRMGKERQRQEAAQKVQEGLQQLAALDAEEQQEQQRQQQEAAQAAAAAAAATAAKLQMQENLKQLAAAAAVNNSANALPPMLPPLPVPPMMCPDPSQMLMQMGLHPAQMAANAALLNYYGSVLPAANNAALMYNMMAGGVGGVPPAPQLQNLHQQGNLRAAPRGDQGGRTYNKSKPHHSIHGSDLKGSGDQMGSGHMRGRGRLDAVRGADSGHDSDRSRTSSRDGSDEGGSHEGRQPEGQPSNRLFVGNLARDVHEEELQAHFSKFGEISSIKVMYNSWKMYLPRKRWRNRGYGFVAFKKLEDAVAARTSLLGARVEVLVRDMNRGLVVQYFNTPEGVDATNLDGF